MTDIIHLLSDTIANQIAAGEVIQRPASVVKELVENAIDAKASQIQLFIKDAGKSLIQVVDNGLGMSDTDARMAFERHATSKIKSVNDLFALKTMGFRGEALASIASVAQVELRTRRMDENAGTIILLSGSKLEKQESIATNPGSVFSVKNLFFNIPARRKFLKSNETEFKNILTEFERIALVNPQISFSLSHNDTEIFNLPETLTRQRIANIFGKNINNQLLSLHVDTSLVKISGFIGTPASSKKRGGLHYFFVNGRYMRHPYFHKAVMLAFEPFIPAGETPNYFIYFDVDPSTIDVNIHPTKTEIKFENEQAIWQIIVAAIKEAIGKANAMPSIEFDREGAIEIPVYKQEKNYIEAPRVSLNKAYNPFQATSQSNQGNKRDWEALFEDKRNEKVEKEEEEEKSATSDAETCFNHSDAEQSQLFESGFNAFQYKGRYLLTPLKSGLVLIHQRRAHIRILYDEYFKRMQNRKGISQQLLFPEIIKFTAKEMILLPYLEEELQFIGFELANLGNNCYSINGVPSGLETMTDPVGTLQNIVDKVIETGCEVRDDICEALALALAKQTAIPSYKELQKKEAEELTANLFASQSPNYTPDGKLIISIMSDDDFEKRFK